MCAAYEASHQRPPSSCAPPAELGSRRAHTSCPSSRVVQQGGVHPHDGERRGNRGEPEPGTLWQSSVVATEEVRRVSWPTTAYVGCGPIAAGRWQRWAPPPAAIGAARAPWQGCGTWRRVKAGSGGGVVPASLLCGRLGRDVAQVITVGQV